MHETDLGSRLRYGFEAQTFERAEVAADRMQGDTAGGEIGRVQRAFETTSADGDDAAEDGGALEEREEVGDEAEAGVVD
jgi:hypothetical protein